MWRSFRVERTFSIAARQCSGRQIQSRTTRRTFLKAVTCGPQRVRCFGSANHLAQLPVPQAVEYECVQPGGNASDFAKSLPVVCPGCGALSQTIEPGTPGYFSQKSTQLRREKIQDEADIYEQAMARLSAAEDAYPSSQTPTEADFTTPHERPLMCNRCHDLLHQSKGTSILHPSMQSIREIIESSPHRHNHIYHVLDAADFPLSLIPNLISSLKLPRLRTQNRRSKHKQYINGREAEVTFIITRSDLLAPQKEQVDRLMPYLQEVLRDALGKSGKSVRLGNVRCVSAKRGWWTPRVKQEIWDRGGAGWVVGKVNVGKSALFEVVYPKGRNEKDHLNTKMLREAHVVTSAVTTEATQLSSLSSESGSDVQLTSQPEPEGSTRTNSDDLSAYTPTLEEDQGVDGEQGNELPGTDNTVSLLPPAQPEMQYPHMPIVSALPGTTASPIRIPYGNGKGELIDLPGVMRSSMETHVQSEHHSSLVMKSRVVPEQYALKPGQSLLIGGIIRITPKSDDLVYLAYPFTPLKSHSTSTLKAIAIQTGAQEDGTPYAGNVENIATETAKGRIKSAGTFRLEWDVTKKRAGPVTDRTAGKQKPENLPFIVYGADILIEGIGWVELVCQVRRRTKNLIPDALSAHVGDPEAVANADLRPEVEIFTPKGKFIGIRRPMNAWLHSGPKKVAKHAQRVRPRMSISMQKRKEGGKRGGNIMSPGLE